MYLVWHLLHLLRFYFHFSHLFCSTAAAVTGEWDAAPAPTATTVIEGAPPPTGWE
jgi:hypothetical protein